MRPFFAFIQPEFLFWPLVILLVGWWLVMRLRKTAGIWRLRYFAMPRPWLKYLHSHVPLYSRLPWELRAPYQDKVLNFVDSKIFRPGGDFDEIPQELRLIIAGNACILQLNNESDVIFPAILTAQVFPLTAEEVNTRSSIVPVLWDPANERALDPHNRGREKEMTAIAAALGAKALPEPLLLTPWARARLGEFTERFPNALENITAGEPVEIFAVATEVFFADPAGVQAKQPALYTALRAFYRVDPARWPGRK